MNKSYLNSINNTALSSKPSTTTRLLLMVLFVCLFGSITNAATRTASVTGNWNNTATWGGGSIPTISDDVVIPNGKTVTVTADAFAKSIVVNNGGTLNVNSPAILTVGTIGTSATTQVVDFQNGSYVNIYTGASMIVYGLLNNSNNSDNVKFDGAVSVDGNVTVGNGSTITGSGSLSSTGTVTGAGTVFGSTNDCTSGNGCNYGCSTNTISANQTVCSGSTATLTGNSGTGYSYQWQSSTTSSSTGFSNVSGATSSNYTTLSLTTTTYYRRIVSLSGCSSSNSNVIKVTVNPSPTITGTLNVCAGSTTTLTGSATPHATTPWTSSATSVATVSSSGVVTGVSGGTSIITYMNNDGCTKTATVTVASLVNNVTNGFSSSSFCAGDQATITFDANNLSGIYPYSIVYKNNTTNATASVTIANDNATTFNIIPNPTTTTSYTLISITDANGCIRTSTFGDDTATATINPVPNAPTVGTITQPTCAISTGSVVLSGLPSSGTWTLTMSGSSSATNTGTGTSTTISGLSTGTYNFTVSNGTCTSLASGNVVINAQPSTPTAPAVSITQPICTLPTGTITVTVQNTGETYSFDNGSTFQSGNSKPGLAAGNYNVIIKSAGGCNSSATSVTLKSATNTWDGSVWSNGSTPISTENIIFNGSYISTSDLAACSCQVNGSIGVTIGSGFKLTLTNGLTVAPSSTMTFQNNSSLVQINNVSNSGNIKYVRTTNTNVLNTDYTYWSSPVSPQTIGSFSPKTKEGMIYSYDSSIDDWKQEYLSTSMTAGFGYIVRGPEPSGIPGPPSPYTATFVGVPNNGDYSISAIADRSYLLGNPYPSALDADAFLNANSNVLDGTLYFWTHNTATGTNVSNPGTGVYAYSGDDYATYNQTGGTAAAPNTSTVPNGKIGAGQGFFASTKTSISGTAIVYNNSMRVGVGAITGTNSQFFKTKSPKSKQENAIEKNRVWLNLKNSQGAFKQTLVGYVTGATNEYDSRFDGESFDGNEFVDFYSVNLDKNLTIQGRALPFDQNDEVPLGFRSAINGDFTISIDQTDGILTNQDVYLEDKLANTVSNLKSGNYTFNTTAGTFNERFVLKYSSKTLGVDTQEKEDGIIVMYSNNYKTLIIRNNSDSIINSVSLFGMTGQKIMDWDLKDNNQTNIQLPIKDLSSGIYIVKIKTEKGESGKKIVVN